MAAKRTTARKPASPRKATTKPAAPRPDHPNLLERGDVFFFYRPDADESAPAGLADVRRFHIVLRPEGGRILRLLTIGRKQLPEPAAEGRSYWAFVDKVFKIFQGCAACRGIPGGRFRPATLPRSRSAPR